MGMINLKEFMSRKYILWGVGEKGRELLEQWDYLNRVFEQKKGDYIPVIDFFIDGDPQRTRNELYGVRGKSPNTLTEQDINYVFIISPRYEDEILQEIEGIFAGIKCDVISTKDFLKNLRRLCISKFVKPLGNQRIDNPAVQASLMIEECLCDDNRISYDGAKNVIASTGYAGFIVGLEIVYGSQVAEIIHYACSWNVEKTDGSGNVCIGMISDCLSTGGAQRVAAILSNNLFRAGYKVVMINVRSDEKEYSLDPGITRVIVSQGGDRYETYLQYYNAITENSINTVLFHLPYSGVYYYYLLLLFKLIGCRLITEIHSSVQTLLSRHGSLREAVGMYRMNDKVVVLSNMDMEYWERHSVNCVYIPNPLSDELRLDQIKRNCKGNLLWVGRIDQDAKNVFEVVYIMKLLKEDGVPCRLKVVGEETNQEDASTLRTMILKYGLEDVVDIEGYHKDIYKYYKEADIMLVTSKNEGFPMILLEAKAYSLPIVMYEIPYLELTGDDSGVINVPQNDRKSAAVALKQLIKDADFYNRISSESWKSVREYAEYDYVGSWIRVISMINTEIG